MSRYLPRLAAVAVICTLAFAILPINAEPITSDTVLVIVYPVSDLPVWRYKARIKTTTDANGIVKQLEDRPSGEPGFDPSLLIASIKASMGAEAWEVARIVPHEKTAALIVRTTDANHRMVAELLLRLRKQNTHEDTERLD